ncbi:heat shock 70 kda protein 14 [Quercus suber]|uniref:Heat shock 70 kDa protein 14 n=1 Tax=Quercus suber TaxID=58331 RepID=A0AAW0KUR1_QUESU
MSVVGFDLGNESCIVAVARQRGIDVVLNDESKRETPAIGQLKILAHSYDRSLGGRDFDEALFQHFAAKFKEQAVLDAATIAGLHPLHLIHETTATALAYGIYKTDLPETDQLNVAFVDIGHASMQISIPILERVKQPLEKALADAGLTIENVHMVEVVGSGSRVPAIIKILTEFFKKDPRRTMNASECVNESFPFSVALSWKGAAPGTQNGAADNPQSTVVFPRGNPIPSVKALTFYRSGTFSVDVQYVDGAELQQPTKISTYTLLEEEEIEVPVSKEPAKEDVKMDTDEAPNNAAPQGSNETDVNMQDAKGTADAPGVENGVPESGDKPVQMEADTKVEAPKKKVKKTNIPVAELVYGGMFPADVQKAVEKEFEMALQDRVMEETKDRKNAVEAYVYDMRNKLSDKYQEFVTDSEREGFTTKLQEVEDWLYEDGEDETKGVYIAKLEELKKQGDPVEERYKESVNRGAVIDQLVRCVNSYREAAVSNDPRFDHIDISEKEKDSLPKYVNPILSSADVLKKTETLDRFCKPIMTKPRPAPAKPATPEAPPTPPPQASEQQQPEGGDANASTTEGAADGSAETPASAEPMDTETSTTPA